MSAVNKSKFNVQSNVYNNFNQKKFRLYYLHKISVYTSKYLAVVYYS